MLDERVKLYYVHFVVYNFVILLDIHLSDIYQLLSISMFLNKYLNIRQRNYDWS